MEGTGMRGWIAAAALALGIAIPAAAAAQEISVSGGGPGDVDVYVAEEGDTLWDVADRFFHDPWYWPTLWSFNPHITNPNWIFPGDLVYLVPPKPVAPKKGGYAVTESRYSASPRIEQILGRRVGYISDTEYEGSGQIVNSREEKVMLSETDEAYVRFSTAKRVKAGDLFLAYRVEGRVKHPVTGKKMGYKVRYLGIAKVTSTEKPVNKIVFLDTYEEVVREDRLAPFAPVNRTVPPVRNAAAVAGNVVATFNDVEMLGEYHYVVIDRGSKDGVVAGNRFVVRDRGDGLEEFQPKKKKLKDYPLETFAEILVIEANENHSLGIVSYNNREFEVGAPCDMLAGY